MDKQNICNSKYFPAILAIITLGMILQIFEAGLAFGQWLFERLN